jgi:hypothetical protein
MAVLNLRGVPDELAHALKVEAAELQMGIQKYCVAILEARSLWATNNINDKVQRVRFAKTSDPKKIAEVSGGVVAQDGLGVDPGLPRGGKAQLEEIFRGVKVNIGLRAQGHFETVERMRDEGKSWDEIGDAIGWAGHAVQDWYKMESPKFPEWSESRLREMAAAEDESLSATGGLLACSPDLYAEMEKTVKPDMQLLRDICAGNIPAKLMQDSYDAESRLAEKSAEPIEVDLCGLKSYSEVDGENYICGKEKHGPKIQHGDWIKI